MRLRRVRCGAVFDSAHIPKAPGFDGAMLLEVNSEIESAFRKFSARIRAQDCGRVSRAIFTVVRGRGVALMDLKAARDKSMNRIGKSVGK